MNKGTTMMWSHIQNEAEYLFSDANKSYHNSIHNDDYSLDTIFKKDRYKKTFSRAPKLAPIPEDQKEEKIALAVEEIMQKINVPKKNSTQEAAALNVNKLALLAYI